MLLALLGSSTVLFHQIAGYTLAVLLGVISILFPPYLLRRDGRRGVYLIALARRSRHLLGFLRLGHLRPAQPGGGNARRFGDGEGGEAVAMAIGTKPANGPGHFLMTLSHPVLWLGLLGLPFMLADRQNAKGTPDTLARLTLLVWTLLLFFGSLTSYSGFPDRFERDLGAPPALLAALALVTLPRVPLVLRPAGRGALAAVVLAVALSATLVGAQSVQSLQQAAGPSTRLKTGRPRPMSWLPEPGSGSTTTAGA